ncbi:MAG: MFS transporter [Legionellaceae bacterium]|nr:MFS transporter [Legionellaceae bacterium]
MLDVIRKTSIPLLSLFIFALGNGFFITLLSLTMNHYHEPPLLIGSMTGIYYLGLVCGSFKIESFIAKVGHIRAFSTFASTLAVVSLLHGIFYNMPLWLILRFIGGFSTAGVFVVIESWLLCNSTNTTRGQVLSFYMITFYASEALGQLLINCGAPTDLLLYGIATMLCSLSVIPLSMSNVSMPQFDEPSTMSILDLFKQTTSGVFGCFFAGMILSATYALCPILFFNLYNDTSTVSFLMFAMIFGGMALQYPVGKISDIIERRLVVIVICGLIIISSLLLLLTIKYFVASIILIGIFGGLTSTVYPISISYSCDSLDTKNIVAGIQGLLLSYSIGATLGPFVAPMFMHLFSGKGLFIYFALISGFIALIFTWRKTQTESPPQEEPFQIMTQTTPIMAEIDPRAEVDPLNE